MGWQESRGQKPALKNVYFALLLSLAATVVVFVFLLMTAEPRSASAEDIQNPQAEQEATTSATINYLENATYEDPDAILDENGRRILGKYVVENLKVGDVLHAWDYVVDIPGHFFFDGWPLNLTITSNPEENVMDLIYVKLWNSEYTVNYYLMTGADLSADTWAGALASGNVKFYKIGSETFTGQRFDALIDGDAYEYMIDGAYVIDTYPAQIRLGTDPDNNVINVLYTPESEYLPDNVEIPDNVVVPDDSPNPPSPGLPDQEFNKDEIENLLPGDDFIGSDIDRGELEITDEMLAHPVNKDQAQGMIDAYKTGLVEAQTLSQTGDGLPVTVLIVSAIAVIAAVVCVIAFQMIHRSQHQK
ncbi:hypothetical protein [Adlercreutzia sp. ZJ154]|uniref:hypothetical protein n=1 Tax=Adlercreutzia sp. ZJ154 TaxID=2709790 RepID=UPI0013EAE8BE|nr:hypothetical protein [Adlercreutzia sp. ZJ154]